VALSRYTRQPDPDFVLNEERFAGAQVLIAGDNFGCGSSREHAVWALDDYGIRCVIAPAYADIFFNNSFKSGLLPIAVDKEIVNKLAEECENTLGYKLSIDLQSQTITTPSGEVINFDIDAFRKDCLLEGLDEIGLTLQKRNSIKDYEAARKQSAPWLFE